jgi:hypothetical protein
MMVSCHELEPAVLRKYRELKLLEGQAEAHALGAMGAGSTDSAARDLFSARCYAAAAEGLARTASRIYSKAAGWEITFDGVSYRTAPAEGDE